jgi:hypothetical protein
MSPGLERTSWIEPSDRDEEPASSERIPSAHRSGRPPGGLDVRFHWQMLAARSPDCVVAPGGPSVALRRGPQVGERPTSALAGIATVWWAIDAGVGERTRGDWACRPVGLGCGSRRRRSVTATYPGAGEIVDLLVPALRWRSLGREEPRHVPLVCGLPVLKPAGLERFHVKRTRTHPSHRIPFHVKQDADRHAQGDRHRGTAGSRARRGRGGSSAQEVGPRVPPGARADAGAWLPAGPGQRARFDSPSWAGAPGPRSRDPHALAHRGAPHPGVRMHGDVVTPRFGRRPPSELHRRAAAWRMCRGSGSVLGTRPATSDASGANAPLRPQPHRGPRIKALGRGMGLVGMPYGRPEAVPRAAPVPSPSRSDLAGRFEPSPITGSAVALLPALRRIRRHLVVPCIRG